MDKIREKFECRAKNMGYDLTMEKDMYTNFHTLELLLGYRMAVEDYKSRDEEIKRLKNVLQELITECRSLISDEIDIFCIDRAEEVLKESR